VPREPGPSVGRGSPSDTPLRLSRPRLAALLEAEGITPRRSLGQHFLAEPALAERIVRLAGVTADSSVLEIGAGLGSLTLALARTGARVVAIEVDPRLVELLAPMVRAHGVELVVADVRRVELGALLRARAKTADAPRWSLVANLPYNVATSLVVEVLEGVPEVADLCVMVQLEVAERLVARAGTPARGAVSVLVENQAVGSVVATVRPEVFLPAPAVASAVVRLVRRPAGPEVDPDDLRPLVRAGFAGRRKMLRRALAGLVDADGFRAAGVDPTARAEDLDLGGWGRLATWHRASRTPNRPRPS
jgi:16S rRNA (adenine1518-N6/adenine1519-N6)-dimethyltransferase